MAHAENQHYQAVIFDLADEPAIAYAVFPELAQPGAVQRFSDSARIVELGDSFTQELQNSFPVLRVEFPEFPVRRLGEFNAPGHGVSSRL